MKKILVLCISIFGIINFANAWTAKSPQTWKQADPQGKTLIVTCWNVEQAPCMNGSGSGPVVGQECNILDYNGKVIANGVIQKAISNPDLPSDNELPTGSPTELELSNVVWQ